MTEDKTITDNEVLAKFENLPPQYEDGTPGFVHEDEDGFTWGYAPEELQYHKKWSWLMPVWYKFRDLDTGIFDLFDHARYKRYWYELANDIPRKPIAHVCKLLAEGIRWYNSTTQNKEQS